MVKAINRVVDSASNGFGASNSVITTVKKSGTGVVIVFAVLAVVVVAAYIYFGRAGPSRCPKTLHRNADGSLKLNPSGQTFPDMNAFQQWWHSSGENAACPLPVLTGAREVPVLTAGTNVGPTGEQTYAKTPIYKVDDYEFSRIFGYERDGHMDVPRQNFNMILNDRTFDWADKPMSSDERKGKYAGLVEGFTAAGELKSEASRHEAVARYGEKRHGSHGRHTSRDPTDQEADVDCKISREAKEVASMVAKAYENDPDWEPIVTKVGANHWEVNELKPRRRRGEVSAAVDERVVDTANDKVDIQFRFREQQAVDHAIDPEYSRAVGELPYSSERHQYRGRMDLPYGPTFDRDDWTVPAPGWK
jgi:hypothetical protein